MDDDSVGARVATLRKQRGMSQLRLAGDAHVSKSLLAKVETGHKPATQGFVAAVARALRVDVTEVTGQPYRVEQEHAAVPELRRALTELVYPRWWTASLVPCTSWHATSLWFLTWGRPPR